jgi:type IV pilus assembly protein PilX
MTALPTHAVVRPAAPIYQRGAALVVGMMLLLVLTILGITGMVTAALELQMSGNIQYQERAFQASEFGIEQAVNAPDLSTTFSMSSPKVVNPTPVPGSTTDNYNYRLYYDNTAGSTPVPGGGYSLGTGLEAYHFVTESNGTSARGAQDAHTQSFYILGPAGG